MVGKAYTAMAPGGGWEEVVKANKEKGFFNHSANAVTSDGLFAVFVKQKK